MDQNVYAPPNSNLEPEVSAGLAPETVAQVRRIAKATKFLIISMVLWVASYVVAISAHAGGVDLTYIAAPFTLIFFAAVIRLSWVLYGTPEAVGTGLSVLIPIIFLVIMFRSYLKAKRMVSTHGLELTFWGNLKRKQSSESAKPAKPGHSCPKCGSLDITIPSNKRTVKLVAAISAAFICIAALSAYLEPKVTWQFLGTLGAFSRLGAFAAIIATLSAGLSAAFGRNKCKACDATWS